MYVFNEHLESTRGPKARLSLPRNNSTYLSSRMAAFLSGRSKFIQWLFFQAGQRSQRVEGGRAWGYYYC